MENYTPIKIVAIPDKKFHLNFSTKEVQAFLDENKIGMERLITVSPISVSGGDTDGFLVTYKA